MLLKKMINSQIDYFDILKSWLGDLWTEYLKSGEDPHDFANQYCDWKFNHSASFNHADLIKDITHRITNYWQFNSVNIIDRVRKNGGMKANYYGDISPLPTSFSPLKALAISDYIIVPCGVEKLVKRFGSHDQRTIYFLLVKHSLQMLYLESYVCSKNRDQSIIIVPNIINCDEKYAKPMFENSLQTCLETINALYDESFANAEEVLEFSEKFSSAREMASKAKKHVINWEPDIKDGDLYEYYLKYHEEVVRHSNEPENIQIFNLILGKRAQSADALFITSYWGSSPLTDNDASYLSLIDYLKYSSPSKNDHQFVDQIFYNTELPFFNFSNLNVEKLKDLQIIKKLRESIARDIDNLDCSDVFSFKRASNRVKIQLQRDFEEYQRSIDVIIKQYDRDALLNLFGIVLLGSITITCSMWPAFLNLASLSGIVGTSSILKTTKDGLEFRKKLEDIRKGYIAILCK